MAKRGVARNKELRAFLKNFPDTDVMELLITDLSGVQRSKRIRGSEFEKTFSKGFCIPGGAVLLDVLGNVVSGISFAADDGDPDVDARIVPGSLAPIPW